VTLTPAQLAMLIEGIDWPAGTLLASASRRLNRKNLHPAASRCTTS